MIRKQTFGLFVLVMILAGCMGQPAAQPEAIATAEGEIRLAAFQATITPVPSIDPPLAPTLVVPTPIPPLSAIEATEVPSVSALERIQNDGVLRVGVLYNNPPMSRLSERGTVEGYEADLALAIAEDWGVEAEFVQVTRQNAVLVLLAGDVDILMSSVVHRQAYESELAFSVPYFASGQMFLVREESDIQVVAGVSGRRVGVVQGTPSERALGHAISVGELNVIPQLYLTLNKAVGGLGNGEVDAVLADRIQLLGLQNTVDGVRIVDQQLEAEPLAVAMRRNDSGLRYLVDRSLQRINAAGTLDDLRRAWYPSVSFSLQIPIWEGLDDDTRGLADFDMGLVYPAAPIIDRVVAGESLRIAGFFDAGQTTGLNGRLDAFYRAIAGELGVRWGVPVELLDGTAGDPAALVASGQADFAIGVVPRWDGAAEVAYSSPIITHGDRMMKPVNSSVAGYADLRGGRWVGVFASEPGTADRVNELAESVNAAVNIFTIINDEDAVFSLTVEQNIDVVFGDSLRLIPQAQASDLVGLTEQWYSTEYMTLAVPRSDPDFWALVELTLQAMSSDGTLDQLWLQHVNAGDAVVVNSWAETEPQFMGVNVRAR